MTDLTSLGFKPSTKEDMNQKRTNKKSDSEVDKEAKDILIAQLSNSHSNHRILEAPCIPKNPTNEILGDLQSTITEESARNSNSTNEWNRVMLFVSLIALVLSATFSILSYHSSSQSSANLEKLILEQNTLLKLNLPQGGHSTIGTAEIENVKEGIKKLDGD
ncbi:hypothetical protein [Pseudoalteromonas sp. C8]|uniref:hypothetical protein n=1 Tax=Pseudoalteromonas sp. C8 TaxID=2686345 RepID=UPI0013FDFAE4|nr:hypothetical protein [Pseudoalteromonas sp. C8]